jgi:hypothetical protein
MPSPHLHQNRVRSGETPARSDTRVVYVVLSHVNPTQVRRLVGAILSGSRTAQVLLHHDEFASRLGSDAFANEPRVEVLRPVRRVEWGAFSQVEALLRSMRWALGHLEFDWLCFISGQDYPLQPLARIERELAEADCDAFMEPPRYVDAFPGDWLGPDGEGVRRYFYRYWKIPDRVARRFPERVRGALHQLILRLQHRQRFVVRYPMPDGIRFGLRRPRRPFSPEFRCVKGSEWGTYSRRCVEVIDDFVQRNPRYVTYFKGTIIPDEAFLPTIVWNAPSLRVHPDYRRFIRWENSVSSHSNPRPSPDVFREQDLPSLLAAQAHFGRKFDASVDVRILDLLDEHLEVAADRRWRGRGPEAD